MLRTMTAALLSCLLVAPLAAQDRAEKRRQRALAKIAKSLQLPVEALDSVRGERYASREASERKALLETIGRRPDGRLFPLILDAIRREPDFANRVSAVKLLTVVGLEADRELLRERWIDALPRQLGDKEDEVFLGVADAVNFLNPHFGLDHDLAPLFARLFAGKNYRLAQKAYFGLVDLQHPELREGPAREALLEVLQPKTRFSVFERKRAVIETGARPGLRQPAQLAELLFADGTVAIECARALAELGDPSVLPALRKVGRTSSHALRLPVYSTRGALGDLALLGELDEAFASDHEAIQRALIQAMTELPTPKVDTVYQRLAKVVADGPLRLDLALARLRRDDPGGVDLLADELHGSSPDAVAQQVVQIDTPAAAPLVLSVARSTKVSAGNRARAVDALGRRGEAGHGVLELLESLAHDEPSPLRLRAAVSLLQLGDVAAISTIEATLKEIDVVSRVDVPTGAGQPARRYRGSVLGTVCQRLAEGETFAAIPMLASWLDPPEPAPADGGERPATGDPGTQTRGDAPPLADPTPAELPKWLRHQHVRRWVVESLGQLALGLRDADPPPAEAGALQDRAVAALARTRADPAALVRLEALRALASLSEQVQLPPAPSDAEIAAADNAVRGWLASR